MPFYGIRNPPKSRKNFQHLTLVERQYIEDRLKKGDSMGKIAVALERSHSCIKMDVQKHGGRDKYNAKEAHEFHENVEKIRRIKLRKNLTEEQESIILESIKNELPIGTIVQNAKITNHMFREFLNRNEIKYMSNNYKNYRRVMEDLTSKVDALGMQLDIILDHIKKNP